MGITSKKMFRNILDIHPCVECDCICSCNVISSTNNPCEGIPWLSVSVQKLVNLVKLGGKLPRLWCPLCLLLTPLGHQRLEFPPLLAYIWTVTIHCRLMSPGSLALITENPCQHQPHPWVPQNSPVSPETVWQPELSMSNTPPPSCTTRRVICRENRRRILILSHNMNKHGAFCGRSINQTDSPNVWKDSPGKRLSSSSARNSLIPGLDQVLLYNSLW